MPGPVSDSYDPEFSTADQRYEFVQNYVRLHKKISEFINAPPVDYRRIPYQPKGRLINGLLCERDWRFIRFAMEYMQEFFE